MCVAENNFLLFFSLEVRFPNQASSIGFTSNGPTAGLLSVCDIPEEKSGAAEKEAEQNDENDEVTLFFFVFWGNCQTIQLLHIMSGLLEMRTKIQVLICL